MFFGVFFYVRGCDFAIVNVIPWWSKNLPHLCTVASDVVPAVIRSVNIMSIRWWVGVVPVYDVNVNPSVSWNCL